MFKKIVLVALSVVFCLPNISYAPQGEMLAQLNEILVNHEEGMQDPDEPACWALMCVLSFCVIGMGYLDALERTNRFDPGAIHKGMPKHNKFRKME